MIITLSSIKNKSMTFLEGQLGIVAFEYLLIMAAVSVVVVGLIASGALDELLVNQVTEVICDELHDLLDYHCDD